jgi:protein phosphatase
LEDRREGIALLPHSFCSVRGEKKEIYEDYADSMEKHGVTFVIVADGQGGRHFNPGRLVVEEVKWSLNNSEWYQDEELAACISRALQHAHRVVRQMRRYEEGREVAAACTVWAGRKEGSCVIGHVGHTRCGLLSEGKILWFTQDTTSAWERVVSGEMTEQDWRTDTERAALTHYIGEPGETAAVQLLTGKMMGGDLFLLTSDGIHPFIDEGEINFLLHQSHDLTVAAEELCSLAGERQQYDDRTVALIAIPNE